MRVNDYLPNVILIVWDTSRARNLSCYGYECPTTPLLGKFGDGAITYRQAVSTSPWTIPSHASLFTGLYSSQHGVHRHRSLSEVQKLVLAEHLQRQRMQTVGFSSNTWISGEFAFDRGFDQFFYGWQLLPGEANILEVNRRMRQSGGFRAARILAEATAKGTPLRNLINSLYGLYSNSTIRYDKGARLTNRLIRRWFQRDRIPRKPFFMFINYMEPHLPYRPPRDYERLYIPDRTSRRTLSSINQDALAYIVGAASMKESDFSILETLYNAELSYLDARFGQLLELLAEEGVLDNTLLIVTSDHGENIGDHGLMDHQYCLYDTLLHVPLLIRAPAGTYAPQVVDQRVETKDIFHTVLDFLEIEDESGSVDPSSRSLLPDRLNQSHRSHCFAEYLVPQPTLPELRARYPGFDCPQYDRRLRAVYSDDGYKLIWASDGKHELYNLGKDPSETTNLLNVEPEKAQELESILEKTLPDVADQTADAEEHGMSRAVRKRLEGLGYL